MSAKSRSRSAQRGARSGLLLVLLSCLLLLPAIPALAAPDAGGAVTKEATPPPAADGFKPWKPPATEQVSAPLFVVIAYSAIWLVVLVFVVSVWTRQRRVEQELQRLRAQLEDPS